MHHKKQDQKSLYLHCVVAEKLRGNPSLLEIAYKKLSEWEKDMDSRSLLYIHKWKRLINDGLDACIAVMTSESEDATALRQASPWVCLLSNEERFVALKRWKDETGRS